jgi:ribosomal protein S18 acetylase RimI-like enzyme
VNRPILDCLGPLDDLIVTTLAPPVSAGVPLDATQREGLERLNGFLSSGGGVLRVARLGGLGVGHVLIIFPPRVPSGRVDDWVAEHVLDDQVDPEAAADELRARRSALMTDLLVVPGHRRRGIGRVLVQDAVDTARQGGAAELALFVAKDNDAARALYDQLGFIVHRDAGAQLRYVYPLSSTTSGA